jgi:uncharacterized membrane protein
MLKQLEPGTHAAVRRRLVPAIITLAAWLVAFLAVMVLLTVFDKQLASLSVALRALVISGVLVVVMVNVVMPVLSTVIMRLLADPADRSTSGEPGTDRAVRIDGDQRRNGLGDSVGHPADPDERGQSSFGLARGWAAYPVHPPLTHVTIGAYTTATVLAVLGASGISKPDTAKGWWLALVVGFVSSIPTSASGLAEFLTLGRRHPARPAIVRHLLPALSTVPCFGAAIVLGHPSYEDGDIGPVPLTLTVVGFVVLTAAGFTGGRLVFTRGLRVKTKIRS